MTRKSVKSLLLAGTIGWIVGTASPSFSTPIAQKSLEGPEKRSVVTFGGGIESVNEKAGIRLEGDATFYNHNRRAALRIDAANLTSQERREFTQALLTLGFKLPDDSKLLLTGGTLTRWHEDSFSDGVGKKGERVDQSVLGLKLTHKISPLTAAYLTALHFEVDSELVHTKSVAQNNQLFLKGYGFGGGTQTDLLIGLETQTQEGDFEIGAGIQRKKFDPFLGNDASRTFQSKIRAKGTIYPTKTSAATVSTDIAADQKALGFSYTQFLAGPWSVEFRADILQRDESPDDRQLFLGVRRHFDGRTKFIRNTPETREALHWLEPVNGADTEHLQVIRTLEGNIRLTANAPSQAQLPTGTSPLPDIIVGQEQTWQGNVTALFNENGDSIVGYEFTSTDGLPAWVSPVIATNGDIRLTGTAIPGNYNINIRAKTSAGLVSNPVQVALVAIGAPSLPSNTPINAAAVASSISGNTVPIRENLAPRFNTGNGSITYVKTAGPAWININPATGQLTGTPGPADGGYYGTGTVPEGFKPYGPIKVKAVSAQGETEELTVNLVVSGPPIAKSTRRDNSLSRGECNPTVTHLGRSGRYYTNGANGPLTLELVNNTVGLSVWSEDNSWIRTDLCTLPLGSTIIQARANNQYGNSGLIVEYEIINQTNR